MQKSRNRSAPRNGGMAMVWAVVVMTAMMAFISLAVDLGRVQCAKTELRCAADAAARYGATGIFISPTAARARAKLAAADNTVDGVAFNLVDADIELGTWDSASKTFTVLSGGAESSATAIRINAARNSAKGNPIPLLFAKVIGFTSCDISAIVVSTASTNLPGAFVGYGSVTVKNNAYMGSYDSGTTTSPAHGAADDASLASNGLIDAGGLTLDGNLILGPSGSASGVTVNGSTVNSPTTLARPASPTWSPSANPGGVPQNYTVGSSTTLAGGTYWFTSLTVSSTLQFSDPATLYVNGDVDLSGTLKPTSLKPADLRIYQIGTHTFGNAGANGMDVVASVSAPNSAFVAKNNLTFRGSAIFDSIDAKNNADFYYDQTLGNMSGVASVSTVK